MGHFHKVPMERVIGEVLCERDRGKRGRWTRLALTAYSYTMLGGPGGGLSKLPERKGEPHWDLGTEPGPALARTHRRAPPCYNTPMLTKPSGLRPASWANNGPDNKLVHGKTVPNECARGGFLQEV